MTDAPLDLLTAGDAALRDWYDAHSSTRRSASLAALRDAIVAQCEARRQSTLTDAMVAGLIRDAFKVESCGAWLGGDDTHVLSQHPMTARAIRAAFALASSPSPDALATARTEAAREALTRIVNQCDWMVPHGAFIKRGITREGVELFRDREYPLPAPPSVTLSDGSVVTINATTRIITRRYDHSSRHDALASYWERPVSQWYEVLMHVHTGADWDAVKALAASLTPEVSNAE